MEKKGWHKHGHQSCSQNKNVRCHTEISAGYSMSSTNQRILNWNHTWSLLHVFFHGWKECLWWLRKNRINVIAVIYPMVHNRNLYVKHKNSPPSKWETENFLRVLTHGSFHRSQIGFQPEASKSCSVRIPNSHRQLLSYWSSTIWDRFYAITLDLPAGQLSCKFQGL
jgi:hypothetical protein